MRILRRLLLVPVVAVAMLSMQAVPAHADANLDFWTDWNINQCLRPDLNSLGQSVHEYSCSDGLARHWQNSGMADSQIWWAPNGGCLVPNWDRLGSPVVVTGGGNVCTRNDAYWEFDETHTGYYKLKNLATGLVLDYDDSGANRGLQLWKDLGDSNQLFNLY